MALKRRRYTGRHCSSAGWAGAAHQVWEQTAQDCTGKLRTDTHTYHDTAQWGAGMYALNLYDRYAEGCSKPTERQTRSVLQHLLCITAKHK